MIQRRNRRRACDVVNWARPARGKAGRPRAQPRGGHDGRTEHPVGGRTPGAGTSCRAFAGCRSRLDVPRGGTGSQSLHEGLWVESARGTSKSALVGASSGEEVADLGSRLNHCLVSLIRNDRSEIRTCNRARGAAQVASTCLNLLPRTKAMATKPNSALTRFIAETRRYPLLTREREREIAVAWRKRQDRAALDELIGSHLRLVVKIARGFAGYGLPLEDLVAQGNMGLMHAAGKFEPERGPRFATYAMWWIRSEIQQYILHSWSLVKIGTTAAQKKLFFNLRRLKARLGEFDRSDLMPETVATIAKGLDVTEAQVIEMNGRIGGPDNSLHAMAGSEADTEWLEFLPDERPTQEAVLGDTEESRWRHDVMAAALNTLNPRERKIVTARRLQERPATLEELSQHFAVSSERIRQIEQRAISKMTLAAAAAQKRSRPSKGLGL